MTDRPKILLVDDRPENLLALEAILGSLDVDLVRANSGEEALRALLRAEFALILLDAQMPGMDGFETAARIKRRTRTKDVPIIFLTAVDKDMSSSYRGYVAGGADYISKPFDPWILRAKVQVFVDLWEAGRLQAAQAALLRDREGAGGDLQRAFWERFSGLEEAVHDLGAQLGDAGPGARAALDRVQQRLEELRGTLDGRVSSS
ncbi:response regulator [Nocardioides koreensis]|uniref:Response regulator n=1 Tax=Nocardioides koreensis TaxID=433651 RepID=A0ABN3A1C7_9ACTN